MIKLTRPRWMVTLACLDVKGRVEVYHVSVHAWTAFGTTCAVHRLWPELWENFAATRVMEARLVDRMNCQLTQERRVDPVRGTRNGGDWRS